MGGGVGVYCADLFGSEIQNDPRFLFDFGSLQPPPRLKRFPYRLPRLRPGVDPAPLLGVPLPPHR